MFETMKEDVEYIIAATNLNTSSSNFPRTHSSYNTQGDDHKLISLKYFRTIEKQSIKKLYDIYRIDLLNAHMITLPLKEERNHGLETFLFLLFMHL